MAPLATLVGHDLRLQFRYGIYAAYAAVVVLYVVGLISIGDRLPGWAPAIIVFADPAAVGFFFLGGLMMLERAEGVRPSLAVAPVSAVDYVLAKTTTLTAVALVATLVIAAVAETASDLPLLMLAVTLTSVQYIGIGIPIALRFRTVNGYLVGSAGFLTPVIAPAFLALMEAPPLWLMIIPAVSQMRLMLVATGAAGASALEMTVMLAVAVCAAAVAAWLGIAAMRREFSR